MSAVEALNAASAAGIHLRLDGDSLLLEASAAPPPAVLELVKSNKAEIIERLRRQESLAGNERAARISQQPYNEWSVPEARRGDSEAAQSRDAVGHDSTSPSDFARAQRRSIVQTLDGLPPANDIRGQRLEATTREFLASQWFSQALACGWSLEDLFSVDASAPLDAHEHWGLVVGLALAPLPNDCIALIDDARAVIRFRSKRSSKNMHRVHKRFPVTDGMVLWWACASLRGDLE